MQNTTVEEKVGAPIEIQSFMESMIRKTVEKSKILRGEAKDILDSMKLAGVSEDELCSGQEILNRAKYHNLKWGISKFMKHSGISMSTSVGVDLRTGLREVWVRCSQCHRNTRVPGRHVLHPMRNEGRRPEYRCVAMVSRMVGQK